jgi:hypothetical protein
MRRIVMNALTLLTVLIWICSLGASSAKAQQIVDAKLEATCSGYEGLMFTATGLAANTSYTAVYTVTSVCPGSTTPTTHNISVTFMTPTTITGLSGGAPYTTGDFIQVGNANCNAGPNPNTFCEDNPGLPTNTTSVQNFSPTLDINGPLSLNADDTTSNNGCQVNATATLTANPSSVFVVNVEGNFAPAFQTVECTQTPACLISPSGTAIPGSAVSWNKFSAPSSSVVWLNAHIGTPNNLSTTQVTQIQFMGVTFSVGSKTYQLPDGFVNFDPHYTGSPTTVFDPTFAGVGAWITTMSASHLSDEIFFDGAAIPVDSNIESGGKATFSYTTLSNDPQVSFNWQWSAAVFTFWPANWNQADILAFHNSDHAGTPENKTVQQSLIQGPRGGGGSNFTGSWSGTGNGMCTNNF